MGKRITQPLAALLVILISTTNSYAGGAPRGPAVIAPAVIAPAIIAPALEESKASLEGKPTLRIYQISNDRFRFESCDSDKKCEAIGSDEGYTQKELEQWQKFRENTAGDILPLMGIIGGIALFVGAIVLMPISVTAIVGASLVAGFAYFFSRTPQVQAGMTNAVYKEFSADPSLVPQLKDFLREVDQGLVTSDKNPRIFSGHDTKVQAPREKATADPALPAK